MNTDLRNTWTSFFQEFCKKVPIRLLTALASFFIQISCMADEPISPKDWKMEVLKQDRYSMDSEKWIVELRFTNMSDGDLGLNVEFAEFENDVQVRPILGAGKLGKPIARRIDRGGMGANIRPRLIPPKGSITQKYNLRYHYIFTALGMYELRFRRFRDFKEAHNAWIGAVVEMALEAKPVQIEVVR